MMMSGERHVPAALYPLERTPGTHWTGGRRFLQLVQRQRLQEKHVTSTGDRTPLVQSVITHCAEVPQITYR
jgi:hypothetical protein